MSKFINRTISYSTVKATKVNTEDRTFEDVEIRVKGLYKDKVTLLKALNKGCDVTEFYTDAEVTKTEDIMYRISKADFMKAGEMGLKPTTRERFITAKIKSTFADVLVIDRDGETAIHVQIDSTGMSRAQIKKAVESDGYIFVKVNYTDFEETPYYMPEQTFLNLATPC